VVDFFTVNWALKLTALVLAFLLWTVVKAEEPERIAIENVRVRVDNRDPDWILTAAPAPQTVTVIVSGPSRELLRLAFDRPEVLVPVEDGDVEDTTEVLLLRNGWVRLYGGTDNVRVEDVRPASVQLTFDRVSTQLRPLTFTFTGSPVPGFEVSGPVQIEPPAVRVSGASRRIATIDSVRLPPIDLSGLSATDTFVVAVDTTGLGVLVSPAQARVIIPVERLGADSLAERRRAPGEPRGRRGS
jgi:YbbR domain-containing protein